jgi:3-deoxy-D-manno-octulosonate 8-phosphate phosphatase (KDO 8-P phosphatase)
LQLAIKKGYRVAIISGGTSEPVRARLERLGVKDVFLGISQQERENCLKYVQQHGLQWEESMYMGDDIPDLRGNANG